MPPRIAAFALLMALFVSFDGQAGAQPARISFQIGAGSTGGSNFALAERIAGLLSHPAGAQRCEKSTACGPLGLIVTARTASGAQANLRAIDSGAVTSGFAQSDAVALAVAGKGPFREGPAKHIRTIAVLFPQDIQLVASPQTTSVQGLRRKRVSLGLENSESAITARAVLAAWHLRERDLKLSADGPEAAAQKLAKGELDAFFFVGGSGSPFLQNLIAKKQARLLPLEGAGRTRLLKSTPGMAAGVIEHQREKIETVKTHTVWIVNDAQPAGLVYTILRAFFAPANLKAMEQANPDAAHISLDGAVRGLPAPLHPGAERFYREMGKWPPKS